MHALRFVLFAAIAGYAQASHWLGGEFRYTHVQGFTYEISFHAWTCLDSPADRPELVFDMGDGILDTVPRMSIMDNPTGPGCCGVRYSVYNTTHTYPGPGFYAITLQDQNRGSGIVNIPNSVAQAFCVGITLDISPAAGINNSVVFTSSPLDVQDVWSTLVHDPMAFDPDGDSLSFELVTPLGLGCYPVMGYVLPHTQPGGWTWLDPATGAFHWHLPMMTGTYTIAIRATEWRWVNGVLMSVGRSTRDMVICVNALPTNITGPWVGQAPALRPTISEGLYWMTNPNPSQAWMLVIDALGRQVHAFWAPSGEHPVELGHLRSGMYLLRYPEGRTMRFLRE